MRTQCNGAPVGFNRHGRRDVAADLKGGRLSTDAGAAPLREADRLAGVTRRPAGCFTDHRNQGMVENGLRGPVAQRVMGIAPGHGDVNGHDRLRGDHVPFAGLRPSNVDPADGALEEPGRIVAGVREAWPSVRITVRGDSGFRRDAIMAWCGDRGVDCVFGLARNPRTERRIARQTRRPRRRCAATGEPSGGLRSFRHRTRDGWSRARRVVGRAEAPPGPRGDSPGCAVTGLPGSESDARALHGDLHRARGGMENRIKERRTEPFADRTSTATMRANRPRARLSAFAGVITPPPRTAGLAGTALARAGFGTIRAMLPGIARGVTVSVRRIRLSPSSAHPTGRCSGGPPPRCAPPLRPRPSRPPPAPRRGRGPPRIAGKGCREAGRRTAASAGPPDLAAAVDVRLMFPSPAPRTAPGGRQAPGVARSPPDRSGKRTAENRRTGKVAYGEISGLVRGGGSGSSRFPLVRMVR